MVKHILQIQRNDFEGQLVMDAQRPQPYQEWQYMTRDAMVTAFRDGNQRKELLREAIDQRLEIARRVTAYMRDIGLHLPVVF